MIFLFRLTILKSVRINQSILILFLKFQLYSVLKTAVQRASNLVLPIQQEETAVKKSKSNITSIDFISI